MAQTNAQTRRYRYTKDQESLLSRLKRIEGQTRGVQRMIEEGRYCMDVVQQLHAVSAAADGVALLVLQDHIEGCVSDAIREGAGEERIRELMETLRRALRR